MLTRKLVGAALLLGSVFAGSASQAAVMYSNLAAWQTAVGTWTETTNLGVANSTNINGATLADGTTLGFAETLQVKSIGAGWSTWCCGYTGQVTESYSTGHWLTEHWTISPTGGFGMFIEPDPFATLNITLTTSAGDTLTQPVNGNGGAAFFGWAGSGITGMTISSSADFAEGDWFTTAARVPEPATLALLGAGLAGLGAMRRRRKAKA